METTARQDVECRTALRHLDRMIHVYWEADHTMAETDPLRRTCEVRQKGLGGAHVGVIREGLVINRPDDVEAQLLGEKALFHDVFEDPMVGLSARHIGLGFINQGKLQLANSCAWGTDTTVAIGHTKGRRYSLDAVARTAALSLIFGWRFFHPFILEALHVPADSHAAVHEQMAGFLPGPGST